MLKNRGAQLRTPRQRKMPNEENASLRMPLKSATGAELGRHTVNVYFNLQPNE
jgi:hypothetical protein